MSTVGTVSLTRFDFLAILKSLLTLFVASSAEAERETFSTVGGRASDAEKSTMCCFRVSCSAKSKGYCCESFLTDTVASDICEGFCSCDEAFPITRPPAVAGASGCRGCLEVGSGCDAESFVEWRHNDKDGKEHGMKFDQEKAQSATSIPG